MKAHFSKGCTLKELGSEDRQPFSLDLLPSVAACPSRQHGHFREEDAIAYRSFYYRGGTVYERSGAKCLLQVHPGGLSRHNNQIRLADCVGECVVGGPF